MVLGGVLLAIAIGAAAVTMNSIAEETGRVEHTLQAEASINRLAAANEQIETGRRGFVIQPGPSFARVIRDAAGIYERELSRLRSLVSDNPEQSQRVLALERLDAERGRLIDAMFSSPARSLAEMRELDFEEDRGVELTRQIRVTAARMAEAEQDLLVLRSRNQFSSLIQLYVVGGLALALLVCVMVAAVILVLRYNRDLTNAQAGLRVANEGLEEAVGARTAELVRANQEIQRFAYIVSHDLRSPLVNVLGFTSELEAARKVIRAHLEETYEAQPELRDEGAWLAVDEDLPEAIGFISTSTEKMDRLINSILELSRQGRRQLHPEMLDMEYLVEGVVTTLHQRAEDANAEIVAKSVPDLESDRIAVEQIISNLAENALKYLSPKRPGKVVIEGSRAAGMVHIDVIDNGRGIDPSDHERVFDLFRRAGTQDQPGEGIGLANVRALAYRLGGTIEVDSQLDQGARFRLSLPAKLAVTEPLA